MGWGPLSEFLGWTSIACWLGAQFPQVLENIRRQSCEGLALPFLLNWLLGDVTNLIGCILTHQLPFQTYLATYFCSVDLMLFSQYFYYRSKSKASHTLPTLRSSSRLLRHASEQEHYRQLSTAAANVAVAAALAASDDEISPRRLRNWRSIDGLHDQALTKQEAAEIDDEVNEEALNALADSFHSEIGRKRVSWSQERYGAGLVGSGRGASRSSTRQNLGGTHTLSPILSKRTSLYSPDTDHHATANPGPDSNGSGTARGRALQRDVVDSPIEGIDVENQDVIYFRSPRERKESRASRKSASLVFLGVWALFGIGSVMHTRSTRAFDAIMTRNGFVVSEDTHRIPSPVLMEGTEDYIIELPTVYSEGVPHQLVEPPSNEPSTERVLGRLSAWMCTTLYLTSRLPQIWKNYVRKSVEGLSMYLFVFAFLGNTFYVLSILTSPNFDLPPPEAKAFLRECIPYLLGSGGTLLFDVTIVTQSFLYRPGRKLSHLHHRPRSQSQNTYHARSGSYAPAPVRGSSAYVTTTDSHPPRSTSSGATFNATAAASGRSGAHVVQPQSANRMNYFTRSRSTSAAGEMDALLDVDDVEHPNSEGHDAALHVDTQHLRKREGADVVPSIIHDRDALS